MCPAYSFIRVRSTNNDAKVLTKDPSLPVSMSAICPSSEVYELTVCLLIIFEQRGRVFELFEALIRYEIERTGMKMTESVPMAANSCTQQKAKLR